MIFNIKIPTYLNVAFEYADFSGLEGHDEHLVKWLIERWTKSNPKAGMNFQFCVTTYDDKPDDPWSDYIGECNIMRVHLVNPEDY